MALAAVLKEEAYNKLPDTLKPEYKKQDDGSYRLDVTETEGWALTGGGLTRALEEERKTNRDLTQKLKNFDGLDAEAAKEAIKNAEQYKKGDPEGKAKAQIEANTKEYQKQIQEQKEASDKRIKTLTDELERALIDQAAMAELAKVSDSPTVLLPHVKQNLRMVDKDGKFVVEVINPATGTTRISTESGNNMSLTEYVTEIKKNKEFAPLFRASNASGTGRNPLGSSAGAASGNNGDLSKLSPTEHLKQARAAQTASA